MKTIKHLNGCLTIRKNVDVPTFLAVFYILLFLLTIALNFVMGFKSTKFLERGNMLIRMLLVNIVKNLNN